MKDLTVKLKNIEYSYKHGLECLAKVATRELINHLPKDQWIFIDPKYIMVDNNNNIKVTSGFNNSFTDNWNELDDQIKLEIYNTLFLKY